MAITTKSFDHKSLDLTDERLETIAKDIETAHANATLHIAAQLAEARDIFRFRRDEGGFGGWVETRLHYSRSKAYNLLNIHKQFGGEKNLSKRLDTFPDSILYLLAAPSIPVKVRDEIIERVQAGEAVSVAEVKRNIEAAKGKSGKKDAKGKPGKTMPIAEGTTEATKGEPGKMATKALDPSEPAVPNDDFELTARLDAIAPLLSDAAWTRVLEYLELERFLRVHPYGPELARRAGGQAQVIRKFWTPHLSVVPNTPEVSTTTH